MSSYKNPLMPKQGSRARRVMDELAKHSGPVEESVLMAGHGLDGLSSSIWRSSAYRLLETSVLAVRTQGSCWELTEIGRRVIDDTRAELARQAKPKANTGTLAAPRSVPAFRPLKARPAIWETREGALDYRNIPSLREAKSCM